MPPTETTARHPHDVLRQAMVERLDQQQMLTGPVAEALRAVPRHVFVPHASVEEAYADRTVSVKDGPDGDSISCASHPAVVARMLVQAQIEPGMRVLEVGAGTGYNAGLLAHLVGPHGQVVSIDVDHDLVADARTHLEQAGADQVQVRCADGALGAEDLAPFDRIIATVGVHHLPIAWLEQLAPGGVLVVPMRVVGDVGYALALRGHQEHWVCTSAELCSFMPLREGIGDDSRRLVDVSGDDGVRLQVNREQDIADAQVEGVLAEPEQTVWTGVYFGGMESMDGMWLWLALHLDSTLSRLMFSRKEEARHGLARGLGWGAMASVPDGERGLAYLTHRVLEPEGEQGPRTEIGVVGHAPAGQALARRVCELINAWEPHRQSRPSYAVYRTGAQTPAPGPGVIVLDRGPVQLVLTWDL
ncbi:methyltransferase, FxLD system [Nocardiopsis metallicus]|uniref:Protein-L-isoaspartate O-methyltransferase n=1 Tax=Nocardiopsis metallicus TaxID=179819 RepID=A0A840WTB5_9ACTN|nr:methyltransferase, FxLD system [Nocardiopsis metallicus]MBB5494846.1 protein-L-isoaspartate(D-aspartate) O-methyltransferase [Nocardiopsis metallicus]